MLQRIGRDTFNLLSAIINIELRFEIGCRILSTDHTVRIIAIDASDVNSDLHILFIFNSEQILFLKI